MGQQLPPIDNATVLHFCRRTEIAWGRGEILRMVAESIEAKDAPTARALLAISDEIIAECEASLAYLETLIAPTPHCTPPTRHRMKFSPEMPNG